MESAFRIRVWKLYADPTQTVSMGERFLGFKEFELDNHLGNVIAVVSDRKIQLKNCANVIISLPFEDPNDLNKVFPDVAAVTIENQMLKIQPLSAYGGVNIPYTTVPGQNYEITFDVNMGTTNASDGLTATAYGYDAATGSYGPSFTHVAINANGKYTINYTGQPQSTGTTKLYFIFGTNIGSSTPHYFYVDNFEVTAIPEPPAPGTSEPNPLAPCNTPGQTFAGYLCRIRWDMASAVADRSHSYHSHLNLKGVRRF